MQRIQILLVLLIALTWTGVGLLQAQEAERADNAEGAAEAIASRESVFAARQLFRQGMDLLDVPAEEERGVKMLNRVIEQYPDTDYRWMAHLALGRYAIKSSDHQTALQHFRYLKELEKKINEVSADLKEVYLESLYLTGVSYYEQTLYQSAFPVLRRITTKFPNTVWANQAYYYIGMCHFMQKNWDKAIKNLNLVGTFIDETSDTAQYAEAGRRFYVKVRDADLPVQIRLEKKPVEIELSTKSGDKAKVSLVPLSADEGVYIGSIATAMGTPIDNEILEVVGGDRIFARYIDKNTKTGEANIKREAYVDIVSTASLSFTLGTYDNQAVAAFLDQPLSIVLKDVDLDTDGKPQEAMIRVISRYRVHEDEETAAAERLTGFREEKKYEVRDEVTIALKELPDEEAKGAVHTGKFGGDVQIHEAMADLAIDKADNKLMAKVGDEIVASYVDELHINGKQPRQLEVSIKVAGTVDTRPRYRVSVVPDPVLRAKKNRVEGDAFLELARIFNSMGLVDGAADKADFGIERANAIIKEQEPIPSNLKEEGFKLLWNLYIEQKKFDEAIATCKLFHSLYPQSLFVDQALMGIARIRYENKQYDEAIKVYQQVLSLENSQAKAEAQFQIAECKRMQSEQAWEEAKAQGRNPPAGIVDGVSEAAIAEYRKTAERFPDSQFAGRSLSRLVDYYINTRDYTQADDLLKRIFEEYPDDDSLDELLLKWVLVSFRMKQYEKAKAKCEQLLIEYPGSERAKQAREVLGKIEQFLNRQNSSS